VKNKRFFKTINSEEKAYLFGFILGDGCINSARECSIKLKRDDKNHLLKIGKWFDKKPFDVTGRIGNKVYPQSKLSLSSIDLVKDLNELGIIKRKTYELDSEKVWNSVPDRLRHHFVRGYFDADGCITFSKKNQPNFSLTSFKRDILDIVSGYINKVLSINTGVYRGDGAWRIRSGGAKNVLAIGNLLYNNHSISLDRKLKLFSNIKIKTNTGFIGISKNNNKWKVKVSTGNGPIYLGSFSSEKEALDAHESYALKFNGKKNGVYEDEELQFWKYKRINFSGRKMGSVRKV